MKKKAEQTAQFTASNVVRLHCSGCNDIGVIYITTPISLDDFAYLCRDFSRKHKDC